MHAWCVYRAVHWHAPRAGLQFTSMNDQSTLTSLTASVHHVREAKTAFLKCLRPLTMDDVVLGQYTAGPGEVIRLRTPLIVVPAWN